MGIFINMWEHTIRKYRNILHIAASHGWWLDFLCER